MIEFSIIIPLYNKERSIKSTVESVLNQSFTEFELIIVNDGSTDKSLETVQKIEDSRIVIINKPNGGVSSARNRGIVEAKYEYIAFLDGDDIWYPNALEEYKLLIENFDKCSVFCTSYSMSIKENQSKLNRYVVDDYYYYDALSYAKNGFALTCSDCIVVKRECFHVVGGFNEQLAMGEDLDMWRRLSEKYLFAKSDVVTAFYRTDTENRATHIHETVKNRLNRKGITNKSQQLYIGCNYFFQLFPTGIFRQPIKSLLIIMKFGDWIFRFAVVVLTYRVLKNKGA
jgi:glycosyltransferase involved in cell wall biosynthesis